MNAARRKELDKAEALLQEALEILTAVQEEEREVFDNMPESMQSGDRGQAVEAAADSLQEAMDGLDNVIAAVTAARDGA